MSIRTLAWPIVANCVFLLAAEVSFAQLGVDGQAGAISGTGVSIVKQKPEFMRMQVQISATGKNLKEALAKLEETRTSALKQLTELGAAKESIVLDGPRPSVVSAEQQQMMEMIMRQRSSSPTTRQSPQEKAKSATLSFNVTADWPLKGKTTEELLLETDALQTKIKAANIAQVGEEELSAEEQELREEMEEMSQNYRRGQQESPGTPNFTFGKKLADETLEKATQEAFAKAKENAARLSKAAGMELGPLKQLNSHADLQGQMERYSRMISPYEYSYSESSGSGDLKEAVSMDFSEVQITVTVMAAFGLKE